jgi:hypothetical protein
VEIIGLIIVGLVILTGLVIAAVMLAGAWFGTQMFPESDRPHPEPPPTTE